MLKIYSIDKFTHSPDSQYVYFWLRGITLPLLIKFNKLGEDGLAETINKMAQSKVQIDLSRTPRKNGWYVLQSLDLVNVKTVYNQKLNNDSLILINKTWGNLKVRKIVFDYANNNNLKVSKFGTKWRVQDPETKGYITIRNFVLKYAEIQ